MSRPTVVCAVCEEHAESTFRVEGLCCHEEVALLDHKLKALRGVEHLWPDVIGQRLRVAYDAAILSTSAIAEAVAETGMRAWLEHDPAARPPASRARSRSWLVALAGAATALGALLSGVGVDPRLANTAFAIAIVSGGVHPFRRAVAAVHARTIDMHVLMTVAVLGGVAIGQWFEAATVVFLFAVAQWLEGHAMDRARRSLRVLMDLSPTEATVRRHGLESRVPVDDVAVGDVIVVRPGERIPLDGEVLTGTSEVNQAPVTGESLPVAKDPGARVFAGTINGHAALEVRVTHLGRDSTIARIIHLVEVAQSQRAAAQQFVDRFARVYTPIVIILAVLIVALAPLLLGGSFTTWLYRSLVLLVIACPCALVISTPVSIVSALTAGARHGVLVKGGLVLERLARIRAVAFDKTGTLTRGVLGVEGVTGLGVDPREVLRIAAAVEARSEHPVGRAITEHARNNGIVIAPAMRFVARPGLGAQADVDSRSVTVGNPRFAASEDLMTPEVRTTVDAALARGLTAVVVAMERRPIGVIALGDRARDESRETVASLRELGIEKVALLTGDNPAAAASLAAATGVDEWYAELLPEEKVDLVRSLRKRYAGVAMVGDGVNDAPALALADVGVAMGVAGSDAALETADVALMADDLHKLPFALRLSRATVRNIQTNVVFALGLKLAFLALAVVGAATLWMAVVADTGASLLVVANGLRLLRTT